MTDDTSSTLDNLGYWRRQAEEARAIADKMEAPESKRTMLDIAAAYYRMALRAEAAAAKDEIKSSS
jgi:hypothetical protein